TTLAAIGLAVVRISFARPLILDHCATGTPRQWNRVHQRIAFIDFFSISFLSIWWTAFHKIEIDSNGTFARLVAARANQPACHPRPQSCAVHPLSRPSLCAALFPRPHRRTRAFLAVDAMTVDNGKRPTLQHVSCPAANASTSDVHIKQNLASRRREGKNLVLEGELVAVRTSPRGSDLRRRSGGDVVERVGDRACRRE